MMIDGIPNRPLYFYQKDIIERVCPKMLISIGTLMMSHHFLGHLHLIFRVPKPFTGEMCHGHIGGWPRVHSARDFYWMDGNFRILKWRYLPFF